MKKGDIKKKEILETAELLFCRNGYKQTSIQDILDRLKSSKGSFYHHFSSKEILLEEICRNRALQIYTAVSASLDSSRSITETLNMVLSGMIPFQDEKISFILMLLSIFHLHEGVMIRNSYCEALSEQFFPVLCRLLRDGNQHGELYCNEPEMTGRLILSLVCTLWTEICNIIIQAEGISTETDLSALLRLADTFRNAIEKILTLPYGSLKLIDIPTLRYLAEQIHIHRIG